MTYRVQFTSAAYRDLKKLPWDIQRRIDAHILALAQNPYPPGAQKLEGSERFFRVRVGDYRIIYTIEHSRLVITIIRVRHRREVYRIN